MSASSSGSAGNGAGGERFDVHGDFGGMSEIQQQLAALSRQWDNSRHDLQIVSGNERRSPRPPLLFKQPRKPKKSGERDRKYKVECSHVVFLTGSPDCVGERVSYYCCRQHS